MYFAVWATDKIGMQEARRAQRPAHRARLRDPGSHRVRVLLGGPTLADDGDTMNGSLLVIDAEHIDAVRAYLADDPYVHAGVYATWEIRAWQCGLGPLATPER